MLLGHGLLGRPMIEATTQEVPRHYFRPRKFVYLGASLSLTGAIKVEWSHIVMAHAIGDAIIVGTAEFSTTRL